MMSSISLADHHRQPPLRRTLTLLPVGERFIASNLSDALTGECIRRSDMLHCERTNRALYGDLVIVNTPDGLLLRRYYAEENYVRLEAANASFPTLYLASQQVHIIGRPYKLVRELESEGV
ncbi:MAG: S24 family peptidase [Pyrinomonadaceae bacterium]